MQHTEPDLQHMTQNCWLCTLLARSMSRRSVSLVTRCREKSAISVPCSLTCSRYSKSARLLSCSRSRRCLRRWQRCRQDRA
jgi:hypothetical protein